MRSAWRVRWHWSNSLLVLTCAVALAQESSWPGDRQDSLPTFQSKVNLVLVPVVVRDRHGRTIGGMAKDDFQIFDKGKPQTISTFSAVRRVDDSNAAAGRNAGRATDRARIAGILCAGLRSNQSNG
jgi:hypothetical protein